jgi:hypothetical protein
MKQITEEMGVHKEWYFQAKEQTIETLPTFINHLLNDFIHDYGTICHAMTSCSIATLWAMNKKAGITGYQAGGIMWEFIRNWNYSHNKTGMKLIDFDNMLYPQYEYKFQKTISDSIFKALQEQAKTLISESSAVEKVKQHWQSIADGMVPFGYKITQD